VAALWSGAFSRIDLNGHWSVVLGLGDQKQCIACNLCQRYFWAFKRRSADPAAYFWALTWNRQLLHG
jgi:hypothetical protein